MHKSWILILILPCKLALSQASYDNLSIADWQSDLQYLSKTISNNYALFTDSGRDRFNRSVSSLKSEIAGLTPVARAMAFSQLLASLGDGHTELNLLQPALALGRLPLIASYFQDSLVITQTEESMRQWLGWRIIQVGNAGIPEIREKIQTLLAHDNEVEYLLEFPNYLTATAILQSLGIIHDSVAVPIILANRQGEERQITFVSREPAAYARIHWYKLRPVDRPPLYLQHLDKYYWMQFIQSQDILYLKINHSNDQPGEQRLSAMIKEFLAEWDRRKPSRTVIDLRLNRGGNYNKTTRLAQELAKGLHENRNTKLWVITDRYTFSAAVVLASQLRMMDGAKITGEEARGNPNGSDNEEYFTLPHSRFRFSVTNRARQHYPEVAGSPYLPLDIPIPWTLNDYIQGVDQVLSYIEKH